MILSKFFVVAAVVGLFFKNLNIKIFVEITNILLNENIFIFSYSILRVKSGVLVWINCSHKKQVFKFSFCIQISGGFSSIRMP